MQSNNREHEEKQNKFGNEEIGNGMIINRRETLGNEGKGEEIMRYTIK